MFRTLIYPSSGACDSVVELPHVVLFCNGGGFSVSVNLWCVVVCVFGVKCFVVLLQLVGVFSLILILTVIVYAL